jgi:hypothetical protein
LAEDVLDTFHVHKIRQVGAKFKKVSFKPLPLELKLKVAEGMEEKTNCCLLAYFYDRAAPHTGLWERPEPGGGEVKLLKQDRKSLALSLLGKLQRLISPASSFSSQKPF